MKSFTIWKKSTRQKPKRPTDTHIVAVLNSKVKYYFICVMAGRPIHQNIIERTIEMKFIKVSTDLELTLHEWPEGTYKQQNKFLCSLIGNGCSIYERVMPKRLYSELGMMDQVTEISGRCVCVLADEEGLLKPNKINHVGSYLYETDKHDYPIMGNILFVGEERVDGGIDFCGIEESVLKDLESKLNEIIRILEREKWKNKEKERL